MERLKQKQIQLLKQQKRRKEQQQNKVLQQIIKEQQSLQIILQYTQQYFKHKTIQNLSEYSPIQISRLIFDKQLQQIKQLIQRFPDKEINIEHFIIIMMKVMKFKFQVSPFYMVGIKDMFYQIVEQGSKIINYPQFFKYILGQLVMMKEQEQNTQFQVQIIEKTKQDYLMHDNGIKRIKYSKDLKIVFSLDQRSNTIKFYDMQMKNIFKFNARKQKHGNKFPYIIDFDYSQISSRLGIIFSDDSISTIHVPNLLKMTPSQFDQRSSNQIVYYSQERMTQIYFIQMLNKWMTINQTGTQIYLYDMQKNYAHVPNQKVYTKIKLNLNDLVISKVVQIVPLSCICIIGGNQVYFYNQNLTEYAFKKFVHVQDIIHFKYSDQKNQFYVCGLQKSLTMFSMNRSGYPSKLKTISINRIIADFEVFPYYDTIVISDQNNDLRLIHQPTKVTYQHINYSHIVKTKDKMINMVKITKNQFCIYQTYLIIINQQKIAIQKDTEYSILPYYYIDKKKDELYISVNHQIISFSLISGQIRKNYSFDSSNLQKHHSFIISDKTPLFILDHQFNIYEVYGKDQSFSGQNHNYKKKVNIQQTISSFYDKSFNTFIIVSKSIITQVRNDSHNNFNLINTFNLIGFNPIIKTYFCQQSKYISFLTNDQTIHLMKNYQLILQKSYKCIFPKDLIKHQQSMILDYYFVSQYQTFVIFTNKNQVFFINRVSGNQVYFDIQEHLPFKLKHLKFINFKYQKIQVHKNYVQHYILITDQSGFIMQFLLNKIYQEYKIDYNDQHADSHPINIRQTHKIINNNQISYLKLSKDNKLQRKYQQIGLLKAHDKPITIIMKIKLEIVVTLTISIDGYIKLWNKQFIPSLMKCLWNMEQIQTIKNNKSINQLLALFKGHFNSILKEKCSPIQNCNKSKQLKKRGHENPPKINYNDPFKIQIENKDIQEIVMQKQNFSTFYSPVKAKLNFTQRAFNTTQKIYPHPWRNKKEFLSIYQKASPKGKYKQKMPKDLVDLRNSLDMIQKVIQTPNYQQAQKILPQLSFYEPQISLIDKKKKKNDVENQEEGQKFESCLYIKTINKNKKKINQFDQIDKQFKKKELLLTARKWVPKKQKNRNPSVSEIKQEISFQKEGRLDPIKSIFKLFQAHNRQVMDHRKGRIIKIPKINQKVNQKGF